jgi:hypothetical protein
MNLGRLEGAAEPGAAAAVLDLLRLREELAPLSPSAASASGVVSTTKVAGAEPP